MNYSNFQVSVKNLTKKYFPNRSFLSLFTDSYNSTTSFSALENVTFSVSRGEAFGIIGRNGAGKSTLLQIIAGTLRATTGSCSIKGRVSALLELGSGFNPDFTGRENVYLAGSILGINRIEMDKRIHEIESFADIGNFIDQPARTYSTGMLMRVAFSVAISVEPDVLIIDEALSVGDILFQQKCNKRLRELLNKGVTLLVVTHDTSFVTNICTRALWIEKGEVKFLGSAGDCVKAYVTHMTASISSSSAQLHENSIPLRKFTLPELPSLNISECRLTGDGGIYIYKTWLLNSQGISTPVYRIGDWVDLIIVVKSKQNVVFASAGCELRDRHGQVIFATGLRVIKTLIDQINVGEQRVVRIRFKLDLAPGQYSLDVGCGAGDSDTNVWQRVLAASIIEIVSDPAEEVVHGIAKLPYDISIHT